MTDTSPTHFLVGGAPEGFDAHILAQEAQDRRGIVLYVARDATRLEAMRESLQFFDPQLPVLDFPAWDCLPYDRVSPNAEMSARRLSTLAYLANGGIEGRLVVLTTLNALTQKIPSAQVIAQSSFVASVGRQIHEEKLRQFLVTMGFTKAATVIEPGDFAIRGGIIDIYAPGHPHPVRLDLFGDVLDGARYFDPETQRSLKSIDEIRLAPVSEVILSETAITRFRQNYRIEFGSAGQDDPLYEAVSAGRKHQGMEHWLPFFHDGLSSLLDYMPTASVVLDHQSDAALEARWEQVQDQFGTRQHALNQKLVAGTVYKPIAPDQLYLSPDALNAQMQGHRVLRLDPFAMASGPEVIDKGAKIGRNFAAERQNQEVNLFAVLADFVRDRAKSKPVVLASYSTGARERLQALLSDEGVSSGPLVSHADEIQGKGVYFALWPLDQGFETKDLCVICEQDILGDRLIRKPTKRRKAENFLTETQSLSAGDLVVHVDHGIGRYQGMEVVKAAGVAHECLLLEYAEGARLYLPVENIELLSKYGSEVGFLDKLGGGAWQAKKARLKQRIRDMAERLIKVAAERALRHAPILEPTEGMWDAFCARFPYAETDDQLSAISDVVSDIASGMPMDRLICGDVGFGKTEVAMRAAFVAAVSGVQVAVIAPTTLLARQHAKAFQERFRGFPVEVRSLSRFVSTKAASETRAGLAEGTVDIVVGTHAVLAKSVRFKNLGLLVVDEEQRFGVAHKERLKQLRSDIHVLTLTATPIPRTLQLSLSGVRDLSIIATPPIDRLAIRTYVSPFDPVMVREALLREHYRGGQSFYVVPKISDLPEVEEFLQTQMPEVKYVVAHGQMAAGALDERMNAFYDGQYDVLLATTIVESGLDIPAANTLVVHRSDQFGLAQLYQIRGRVGRSKTRAFAYLTTKPKAKLTDAAQKRLRVLSSLDSLGAGFNLASQDLDIRGAGNLLGDEQSGQMRDVGYELYQSMLEEAIAKIKSGEGEGLDLNDDQWAPQINLGVSVLIPDDYIPDLDVRLGIYRRMSSLEKKVELEGLAAELIDRFGPLPKEVNTLILIMRIKAMCKRAGIAKLDGGPKGATVQFHNDKFASPHGLMEFLQAQNGQAKVKDNKIIVRRDWAKTSDKIKGAFSIAQDLAKKAAASKA